MKCVRKASVDGLVQQDGLRGTQKVVVQNKLEVASKHLEVSWDKHRARMPSLRCGNTAPLTADSLALAVAGGNNMLESAADASIAAAGCQ